MNNVITNYDSTQKTQFEIDLSNLIRAEMDRLAKSESELGFWPILATMAESAGRVAGVSGDSRTDVTEICYTLSRVTQAAAEAAHLLIYGEAAK